MSGEDFKKPDGAYHHGDLKSALIEAASVILETRGVEALSLREAARRAGVSEAAPYRHFPDKAALIGAVIAQSVAALTDEISGAMTPYQGEGKRALQAGAEAMLRFAFEQSGRYRLFFQTEPADLIDIAELFEADAGGRETARRLFAFLHGLAALVLTGQIEDAEAYDQAKRLAVLL